MEAKEFLMEITLNGVDNKLQSLFTYALAQVFSTSFLNKIEEKLLQTIQVKEVVKDDENVVAYQSGNVIYINKPVFYQKTQEQKIQYLLHEAMHLIQNSKHSFFSQNFKEFNELSKELYATVKGGLTKPYSVFLTGQDIKLPTSGHEELLPYFANNKIDWSAITPQTRISVIRIIQKSGLFNLRSKFWSKRLYSH